MVYKIAFIGKMHSGKTTAVDTLFNLGVKNNLLCAIVKFAKPLYECQNMFSSEGKNRLFLQELSSMVKKHFGKFILSDLFVEQVKYIEMLHSDYPTYDSLILCDDIRVQSDFYTAINLGFKIIGIDTPDEVRKQRNPDLFLGTNHETEKEIDKLFHACHSIIKGDMGTIEDFKYQIAKIWTEMFNQMPEDILNGK